MKQKSISYLFVCFLLFLTVQEGYAQSVIAIKKRADAAFEKKEYESAKVDYRQLLAQNQKNLELNYKYATCIFYTEDIKNARKYYDFILAKKDAVFPLETYYYLGKIYQHQYYFETAIQQFKLIQQKDEKLAIKFSVQGEIESCQAALAGMKDMRTLQVVKKSQPFGDAFYDHYTFLDDSYSFYKASEVFAKENAKHQYEPIYAFKRGMKFRVFASYGPESPNLDVYIQRKNTENEWDKPMKIIGSVNTAQDEVYPFYDAENGYLYFSSKGHQSMGGFDLYRSIYSLESNQGSDVENLHFPFSSPNDDYFYIPDLSNGNANFASNRNGKLSAIQTYLVSAAETPKELYFFTGLLSDKIDQSNSTVKVEFIVPETNERFGPFISQGDGSYLVGLPGPGTYQMEISVTGSNQLFKEQLTLPLVEEGMELQQELIYAMVDSKEELKVINRVKPKQVESMQLLSQKMNLSANLDVNLASFNRKNILTTEQKIQQDWGLIVKDTSALIAILADSLLAAEVNMENQVRLTNYLANELDRSYAELSQEMKHLDERLERGSGTIDPMENERWMEETKRIENQISKLEGQVNFLESWMTANHQRGIPNVNVLKDLEKINQQVALLQYQHNSEGIMELMSDNKSMIKDQLTVAGEDLAAVIRTYTEEQQRTLVAERKQYQEQVENQITLEKEIEQLKEQATLVKPKDRSALEEEIQRKSTLNNKITQELSDWSMKLNLQEQAFPSYAQVEQEVQEKINASEKMPLPTSAIPFDLIKEQARQEEIAQKRQGQKVLVLEQERIAKEWKTLDPSYATDISKINEETDAQKRSMLLKEREQRHIQELKNKATTANESTQALVEEQIQLSESRIQGQLELLAERERAASAEASAAEGANVTATNQQSTETEQGTGINATETNPTTMQSTNIGPRTSGTGTETERASSAEASAAKRANTTTQQSTETEQGTGINATETNPTTMQSTNIVPRTSGTGTETETETERSASAEASAAEGANTTTQQSTETEQGTGINATETNPTTMQSTNIGPRTSGTGTETERSASAEASAAEGANTSATATNTIRIGGETNAVVPQTILVDQVKETPRMASIEQVIRQVEQTEVSSINAQEKASMIAELEESLLLEKRRAAITESIELLGAMYPSVRVLQASYEQGLMQVNSLNLKALEQALSTEKNPEKANVIQAQIASLNVSPPKITKDQPTPVSNREVTLPISTEEPANLSVLQAQSTYVQYANLRVILQQNGNTLDSLTQAKTEVEDSLRMLLTESNEIAMIGLQQLAARHEAITQDIDKRAESIQEQQERLLDFKDHASYEWMMQNGIQARSMLAASNAVSIASPSTPVPFAMTPVATMNQRFPDHPINVALPEGLIFRVQVGAFRKPVPNQLFREFGPVSGEVLTNGLTCYLAGYFNGSVDAIETRTMIRRLGYADAFIVAYCDGKRMSFNEGKTMEANGTCRKQTAAELQLALNQLMNQNPATLQTPSMPTVFNIDPNSTEANLDLYYTVQVAVYNKPLNSDNINGVKELLVTKTEKGQFRYSSGEFTSFAEARQRKNEVITKGIPDAYVVAYYRGKRISIGEANQLLASGITPKKRGTVESDILENVALISTPVVIPALNPVVKRDSIVQYAINVNEDNYLSQLTRLNRIGTFTYQAAKNRIVSEKYVLAKISLNQQMYLADMKRTKDRMSKIPVQEFIVNISKSDCYDWLLRQSVSYDAHKENEEWIFRFYPENEEQKEWIQAASQHYKWTIKK